MFTEDRLDELARTLAEPMSRPRALRLAGGALLGMWLSQFRLPSALAGDRDCTGKKVCVAGNANCFTHCCPPDTVCCWGPPDPSSPSGCITRPSCCDQCDPAGSRCVGGRCGPGPVPDTCQCPDGGKPCGSDCCRDGEVCRGGRCICPKGTAPCGKGCCSGDEVCRNGKCCSKKPVSAKATAKRARRGGQVTLDATNVKGHVRSYEWELRLGADCPDEVKLADKTLKGRRQTFTALCTVHATLTVTDGCGSSKSTSKTTAEVKPRTGDAWVTKVVHAAQPEKLSSALTIPHLLFGKNVCTIDGQGDHFLHRPGQGPGAGYEHAEVKSGPFRGNWYVTKYTSRVTRKSLVTQDLDPASELYRTNVAAGNGADIAALRASVLVHERLHTTLVAEQVKRRDRAKDVEAMVYSNQTRLTAFAGAELSEFESELKNASRDANIKNRMKPQWDRPATVLVRDGTPGGFTSRTFPSLAEIGDESFS